MNALQQQAFRLAASELGMATAAWLFVQESAAISGPPAVAELRDAMGRAWPVLDAVCAGWLAGGPARDVDVDAVLPQLEGISRLVLVGYEAAWVDSLLAKLPAHVRVGLMQVGDPMTHWARLLSNHGGRVEALSLADFQAWAGPRSVMLTFVYGASERQVFVLPSWLRAAGADVRLQFRSLLGWRILDVPLEVYPRWLVAADVQTLTDLRPSA
ncbi:MAG: hypothetical protein IPG93_12230 [Burkholderiales bacterium]|nr:hypothetical protein [Burkholderiales bacterium]